MTKAHLPQKSFSSGRSTTPLSSTMEKHLRAYALSAAAAGVGLLSLSQPAQGQVIYTPANIKLTDGNLFLDLDCGPQLSFWIADNVEGTNYGGSGRELALNGSTNAGVMEDQRGPLPLPAGVTVGSSRTFTNVYRNERVMANAYFFIYYGYYTGVSGNWAQAQQAYLGLKFDIQGQAHYGWAEFSVKAVSKGRHQLQVGATLLGYAYESTPGMPIKTGQISGSQANAAELAQPGSLQALAQGAARQRGSCPDYEPHGSAAPRKRKQQ